MLRQLMFTALVELFIKILTARQTLFFKFSDLVALLKIVLCDSDIQRLNKTKQNHQNYPQKR